jgi:hypothetical protein
MFKGINPLLFGVHCRSCGANIPATHHKCQDAISAWNRRSGLAAMGGRATRGIRSRRKLVAARRNLKMARQWKLIRQRVEAAHTALKPLRAAELAEKEAALAADLAWLKEREPVILADPVLRQLYDLLPSRRASAAIAQTDQSSNCARTCAVEARSGADSESVGNPEHPVQPVRAAMNPFSLVLLDRFH